MSNCFVSIYIIVFHVFRRTFYNRHIHNVVHISSLFEMMHCNEFELMNNFASLICIIGDVSVLEFKMILYYELISCVLNIMVTWSCGHDHGLCMLHYRVSVQLTYCNHVAYFQSTPEITKKRAYN